MEPILTARIAILLACCAVAAYKDARAGLIPDKVTYPMIALGVALNLLEMNWLFLAAGAAVFAIGYAVYYAGKIGGGDVKLFTGIAFLLPLLRGQIFLLNALFVAAMLAVSFYGAYYFLRYARKGIKWRENRKSLGRAVVFGVILAAYFAVASYMSVFPIETVMLLALPIALALLFVAFERGIRKEFFLRTVALGKLEEDEVIAAEFLEEKVKEKLGLKVKGVFGEKEIAKLKVIGVRKVPVYRGMPPFAPFILLGCIVAVLQPNLINFLFMY